MNHYVPDRTAHARGPREWWRGLPPRQRRILWLLLAAFAVMVLIVGALLARYLSAENAERDGGLALVQAEVKGDARGMLRELGGCEFPWLASAKTREEARRACLAGVRANAANPALRRTGAVKILQLESKGVHSRFGETGKVRLAWTVIGKNPVVQCIDVRRTGNFLIGVHVQLLGISAPISGEGACTKPSQIEREEEEATEVER